MSTDLSVHPVIRFNVIPSPDPARNPRSDRRGRNRYPFLFHRQKKTSASKLASYECGVPIKDTARKNFSVKFYLIAILFILFDVEIIYLYPWAVVYGDLQLFGAAAMGVFFLLLVIGFLYEWKRGALEWD